MALSLVAATFVWLGGWVSPDFEPGWTDGRGLFWALAAAVSTVVGAGLTIYVNSRASRRQDCTSRLSSAADGFAKAGLVLASFTKDEATAEQSRQVRKDLASTLAECVTFGDRQARLVVYFLEREESNETDGDGTALTPKHNRFFQMDCYGGRADHPVRARWDSESAPGQFFCDRMLSGQQTIVSNTNRAPKKAKLDVLECSVYGSFILTPIKNQHGQVRGAVSIDYPGKSSFDPFDVSVSWRIANLFRDTFEASVSSAETVRAEVEATMKLLENEVG